MVSFFDVHSDVEIVDVAMGYFPVLYRVGQIKWGHSFQYL